MNDSNRTWGRALLRYCPVEKVVWQPKWDNHSVCYVYQEMPTYGLDREILPKHMKKIIES